MAIRMNKVRAFGAHIVACEDMLNTVVFISSAWLSSPF